MRAIKRWIAETMLGWERKATYARYNPEPKAMLHRWRNYV